MTVHSAPGCLVVSVNTRQELDAALDEEICSPIFPGGRPSTGGPAKRRRAKGATLHAGGELQLGPAAYIAPAVLTGVRPGMRAYKRRAVRTGGCGVQGRSPAAGKRRSVRSWGCRLQRRRKACPEDCRATRRRNDQRQRSSRRSRNALRRHQTIRFRPATWALWVWRNSSTNISSISAVKRGCGASCPPSGGCHRAPGNTGEAKGREDRKQLAARPCEHVDL
jgi:hypothetical protein